MLGSWQGLWLHFGVRPQLHPGPMLEGWGWELMENGLVGPPASARHNSPLEGREDAHSLSPLYFVLVLDPILCRLLGLSNLHDCREAAVFSAHTR